MEFLTKRNVKVGDAYLELSSTLDGKKQQQTDPEDPSEIPPTMREEIERFNKICVDNYNNSSFDVMKVKEFIKKQNFSDEFIQS